MEFWSVSTFEQKVKRLKKYFDKYADKRRGNGCWGWKGTLLEGRGRLSYDKKQIQAHRASWMIYKGPIPEGMYVCHTCDNEVCTNPRHLFLGSCADNIRDMFKKGRSVKAKLTVKDVKEIRCALLCGQTGSELAAKYGVDKMTISDIKLLKTWTYLKD